MFSIFSFTGDRQPTEKSTTPSRDKPIRCSTYDAWKLEQPGYADSNPVYLISEAWNNYRRYKEASREIERHEREQATSLSAAKSHHLSLPAFSTDTKLPDTSLPMIKRYAKSRVPVHSLNQECDFVDGSVDLLFVRPTETKTSDGVDLPDHPYMYPERRIIQGTIRPKSNAFSTPEASIRFWATDGPTGTIAEYSKCRTIITEIPGNLKFEVVE